MWSLGIVVLLWASCEPVPKSPLGDRHKPCSRLVARNKCMGFCMYGNVWEQMDEVLLTLSSLLLLFVFKIWMGSFPFFPRFF